MIALRPASPAHLGRIATRMRDADRLECEAMSRSAKEALRYSLRASVLAFTAMKAGVPVAMMGVTPGNGLEGIGHPWMLGTDAVFRGARALMEMGPLIIGAMHHRFRRLENKVWAGNDAAIRTLRHWGFRVGEDVTEVGGLPFLPFWREI